MGKLEWRTVVQSRFNGGPSEALCLNPVRLPAALMQPIASDDVVAALVDVALAEPLNGTVEVAGPEPIRQDELVRKFLSATGHSRTVTTDPSALYFGIALTDPAITHASARLVSGTGSVTPYLRAKPSGRLNMMIREKRRAASMAVLITVALDGSF